ncbi:type II secretion system protein [Siminovitchia sediminis]|uniref:Type II secretion system protein n=1 Tax=Siminovitchia sediminis TaxID=1274353 RepID=A0ABW4KR98_9BACI
MKKILSRLKNDQRGLTLVELLAVVVILAIVSSIAVVTIGNVIDNSKKDAHIANAQQLIAAAKIAEAEGVEITASGISADSLNTLSPLTDPWNKGSYSTATVSKSGSTYSATLSAKTADSKCKIAGTSEADLNKGRKTVCP